MVRLLLLILALALLLSGLAGCGERRDPAREDDPPFTEVPADAVAVVVLDLSGSFEELLLGRRDNRAFAFLTRLIHEFFHAGIGREQRLVIAQISGTDKALVFEGSVRDFAHRFPDADAFADQLKKVRDPNGSRVYDSIADALAYATGLTCVRKGHTTVGLFVLSDFEDNAGRPAAVARLDGHLKALRAEYQGVVGFYFVDQALYPTVTDMVRRHFPPGRGVVTSDVTTHPPIPALVR